MMYKEATRMKLRVPTPRGPLAIEQLWDLKLDDLATVAKTLFEEKKKFGTESEELDFLEGTGKKKTTEQTRIELAFDIVKDIYETKTRESKEAVADLEKKKEKNRLLEIIQRKKEEALEGKSIDELEKMVAELDK